MGELGRSALYHKRVLITRAKEQSETLFQRLLALEAIPICAPMIEFAPPEETRPIEEAIRNLGNFDWVFLTSQNAFRFVLECADLLGVSLSGQSGRPLIAAVGPVTAAAAEKAGLAVEFVSKKHQGIGLAEELGPRLKGKRVLLPRSDKASPELPNALREHGAEVVEVTAYRTLQTQTADDWLAYLVRRGEIDAAVFFSPSAVHHFTDLLGSEQMEIARRKLLFVAIGPVTAGALRESGVERVLQARDTEAEAVLEVLNQVFPQSASGAPAGAKQG